ncbi:MAG: hypothetical protein HY553_10860 [Elusimicrobia bacterium]|nr:hypothetical protein [Elusimicrobiota bacterium]
MNERVAVFLGWVVAAVALAACGGNRALVGKQQAVDSMPKATPAWVAKASFESDGMRFYRGAVTGRSDMALGLREARAEAEKAIAEEVKQRIRTEFGSAIEGQNLDGALGSHVRDLIAKVSENVSVSGIKLSEQYVQKLEERTPIGVRYVWDCYALAGLSQQDYLEARTQALSGAVAKAREEKNLKAERSLNEAFRALKGPTPPAEPRVDAAEARAPAGEAPR